MSSLFVGEPTVAEPAPTFVLRDYQRRAVDSIGRCLAASGSTLLVQPTGTGKTVVFAHTIKNVCPADKRALVLAHRQELIHQAARTIGAIIGEPCAIEMADRHADLPGTRKARVVVASKDTLHAKRLQRFNPSDFGLIITDECFPAGTLVDGVPIETIKVGSRVRCLNHATNNTTTKLVTRTFRSVPTAMVRVYFSDGRSLCCTPGHPFHTEHGYLAAIALDHGDMVSTIHHAVQQHMHRVCPPIHRDIEPKNLLGCMPKRPIQEAAAKGSLFGMYSRSPSFGNQWARVAKAWRRLLLGSVQKGEKGTHLFRDDGQDKSEARIGTHEIAEPHAAGIGAATSFGNHEGEGMSPDLSWRQRNWSDRAGATASGSVGMDNRLGGPNPHAQAEQGTLAVALQDRRGERTPQDCRRNRWRLSQNAKPSSAGQEKRRLSSPLRVDRVEVLERGCDGTFGGVCPDGFVYNIEVEQHHNYFANGVLVHNCHHAIAESYKNIYDYFEGVPHLGVTATPDRHDEEALGQIYNSVAMVYEIADAIDDGWLVPITAHTAFIHGLELAGCRTTAGDLNASDLAAQLEQEKPLHKMAATMHELAEGRRAIVFTATVRQAAMLAEVLNDYEPDSARWVCGETQRDQRDSDLRAHRNGEYRWMLNCGIATEGYDDPTCDMIVVARPTKSRSLFAQMLGRGTRPAPGCVDGIDTPHERQAAIADSSKPDLLCIAEGTPILTDAGLVPIESVTTNMRVWDGVDFVTHSGTIFRGEKEVVTYAGLATTPDHKLWTAQGWKTARRCAIEQAAVCVGESGGRPIREADGYYRRGCPRQRPGTPSGRVPMWRAVYQGLQQCCAAECWMPKMRATKASAEVAREPLYQRKATMYESKVAELCQVRQERHSVQLCVSAGNGAVGDAEPWGTSGFDARSYRQRWALRTGQPPVFDPEAELVQHEQAKDRGETARFSSCPPKVRDVRRISVQAFAPWMDVEADFGIGQGQRSIQRPERVRVYDILNAGPRNRFVAAGLIVSNCIDFVGNCGRHKLVGPADVLGGNYSDDDIAVAADAIQNGDVDVCEALEDARRGREERAESRAANEEAAQLARNRARIMATAKYLLQEMDLFGDSDGHHHGRERGWDVVRGKEPTQLQIDTLAKAGFAGEDVRMLNRSQCSKLIGEIIMRRTLGLCTIKQARLLAKFGIDASRMSFEDAGAAIGKKLGRR